VIDREETMKIKRIVETSHSTIFFFFRKRTKNVIASASKTYDKKM